MINLSSSNKNKYSWYCVKVKPRKELLAMKHLNSLKIENYLPIIKNNYKKNSSLISKKEFLFPGYIFVKFNINTQKRAVSYCAGISHIISFNNKCMIISDNIISLIKNTLKENMQKNPVKSLKIGDHVIISSGFLSGHVVIVSSILPTYDRIKVLFDLIGSKVELEVSSEYLKQNHSGVVLA